MTRKRKKIIKITRKLPTVYNCPSCGKVTIRINRTKIKEENPIVEPGRKRVPLYKVRVLCGDCQLSKDYETRKEPIDIFNDFVDWFMQGG